MKLSHHSSTFLTPLLPFVFITSTFVLFFSPNIHPGGLLTSASGHRPPGFAERQVQTGLPSSRPRSRWYLLGHLKYMRLSHFVRALYLQLQSAVFAVILEVVLRICFSKIKQ
uniref:Uncharacterized protein n=1 Tax=Mastacembelus armatus TaxID=205130 RepID=A0A7N8XHF9_9TELE